jgi:hypothetical protein
METIKPKLLNVKDHGTGTKLGVRAEGFFRVGLTEGGIGNCAGDSELESDSPPLDVESRPHDLVVWLRSRQYLDAGDRP